MERPSLSKVRLSISSSAFGESQAEDPDQGINGEIRYQILGREDAPRFAIDPLSGQVRSVASFGRDAGRVFGFDVKATDRQGAENGRSSIANVFVSCKFIISYTPTPCARYILIACCSEIAHGLISPSGKWDVSKDGSSLLRSP